MLRGGLTAAGTGPYGVTSDDVTHVRNIAKHADSSEARLVDGYFYGALCYLR